MYPLEFILLRYHFGYAAGCPTTGYRLGNGTNYRSGLLPCRVDRSGRQHDGRYHRVARVVAGEVSTKRNIVPTVLVGSCFRIKGLGCTCLATNGDKRRIDRLTRPIYDYTAEHVA